MAIATYPLLCTFVLWLPAIVLSVVFAIIALRAKSERKGFAIAGLVLDIIFVIVMVIGAIIGVTSASPETSSESQSETVIESQSEAVIESQSETVIESGSEN